MNTQGIGYPSDKPSRFGQEPLLNVNTSIQLTVPGHQQTNRLITSSERNLPSPPVVLLQARADPRELNWVPRRRTLATAQHLSRLHGHVRYTRCSRGGGSGLRMAVQKPGKREAYAAKARARKKQITFSSCTSAVLKRKDRVHRKYFPGTSMKVK